MESYMNIWDTLDISRKNWRDSISDSLSMDLRTCIVKESHIVISNWRTYFSMTNLTWKLQILASLLKQMVRKTILTEALKSKQYTKFSYMAP